MDRNSPWGIVCHSTTEWDIAELHAGGVAFLRIDFLWEVLQPQSTSGFQWLFYDRVVRWAADRGMWILAGLGGTPRWAVDPARMSADGNRYRPGAYPPQDPALWKNFVGQVLARYGSRVHYWGIWNEPDSFNEPADVCFWRGTQQEFFEKIMEPAVDVIRGFPDANICAPDIAKSDQTGWIKDLLARRGDVIRAVTVHIYRGTGTGTDVIERARIARDAIKAYNAAHGTRVELWITETGWKNWEHPEEEISRRIQNLVASVRSNPWVAKVFPYVWFDFGTDAFSFKSAPRVPRLQWGGYKAAIDAPQPRLPLERDSLLVAHNVPAAMKPGQSYDVQVTFRNIGRWTWTQPGAVRLRFGSRPTQMGAPFSVKVDVSDARLLQVLELVSGITSSPIPAPPASVPPNGQVTFNFRLTAPAQPMVCYLALCMVDNNPADPMFFGEGLLQRLFVS